MTVREHLQRALALLRKHPVGALAHVRKAAGLIVVPPPKPPPANPTLSVFGVDYSSPGPRPYDALAKAGVKFVMRYISFDPSKDLTKTELAALHRRGIKVGLVFETTAERALQGHDAGAKDATYAASRAKGYGLAGAPIYFAVDFDATDRQKPVIAAYLTGAVSVLTKARVGVYGSYYVVRYMAQNDVCGLFWQTYAWSGGLVWWAQKLTGTTVAPKGHLIHPSAHIYQFSNGQRIGGLDVDFNKATSDPTGFGAM